MESEACLDSKKLNPEDMESEGEHREVSKERAAVETGKEPRKRQRDRHLAVGSREKTKELTQRLWIPEEVGCRLQEGVPPCKSGMAQEEHRHE
jgi:hypothetical protein